MNRNTSTRRVNSFRTFILAIGLSPNEVIIASNSLRVMVDVAHSGSHMSSKASTRFNSARTVTTSIVEKLSVSAADGRVEGTAWATSADNIDSSRLDAVSDAILLDGSTAQQSESSEAKSGHTDWRRAQASFTTSKRPSALSSYLQGKHTSEASIVPVMSTTSEVTNRKRVVKRGIMHHTQWVRSSVTAAHLRSQDANAASSSKVLQHNAAYHDSEAEHICLAVIRRGSSHFRGLVEW